MDGTKVSKVLVRCNKNFCAFTPTKKIKKIGDTATCPHCGAIWKAEVWWIRQ